ncbi:MAG: serine hydrolase [Oscillospiraceae bacterium]|nr:serine hydrolase [Oscillospiraceae bacterium]
MKMLIGEMAKKTGVTVRTLQYYDSIGLLKPAEVSETGYRYYDEHSLKELRRILHYKELGFPLRELCAADMPSSKLLARRRRLEDERSRIERLIGRVDGELSRAAAVSPWFDKICRDYNYSGFAYCRGSDDEYFAAWGCADFENDIGFTPRCRFPLGWVTTQLTAYCVLLFAEKALISLDSAVSEHFPETGGADGVTVRDLLNMTSDVQIDKLYEEWNEQYTAFSDLTWEATEYRTLQRTYTPCDIIEKITFGNKREFCVNMANYDILRLILEKSANLPFADILEEYICKPLRMLDTTFSGNSDTVAYSGAKRVEGEFPNEVVTTAEDLAKFYAAILDGGLLPLKKYLREIPEGGFGCGWYCVDGVLTHNSDFGGFALETELRPEDGRIWINLRNRLPVPDNGDRIMYYDVKNCGDGYVKLETWETDSGAEFGVYSIKVFDSAANELYAADNNGEYFIEIKNTGEKRQAAEFAEKYFYEFDLKDILGEKFRTDVTYLIEARAHCGTLKAAQLGCVYQNGGKWISGDYWVFRAPWQAYDLFLEQLNMSRIIE